MAYPDLYSDESIVLNAQNIKVKSVSFDAVLTTRRLILVDSKKHLIQPQEILLATLKDVEVGENAIRDPTVTLSIITPTGATRQMILTFSKTSGGERRRECEEWVKALRQNISSAIQHPIMPDTPRPEQPEAPPPVRMEVGNVPQVPAQKKKIEIARPGPIKKIVETPPAIPKPVETSSLPSGSFCNRCGNRIPADSAFCNKCGTPVVREGAAPAAAEPAPVPQVQVPTPPVFGTMTKERPIEEVIHSIEPLIEDSVPRTEPAPLVPRQHPAPATEPVAGEPEAPAVPAVPADATAPAAPAEPAAPGEEPAFPDVKWPVISSGEPEAAAEAPAPAPAEAAPAAIPPETPATPPHFPIPPARSKKPKGLLIGVVAVVIIAIVAAAVLVLHPFGAMPGTVTPVTTIPTTVPTTVPTVETTVPTPEPTVVPETPAAAATPTPEVTQEYLVPQSGVWVHVSYKNQFTGSVGLPGNLAQVTGTGDKFFQVPTSEGIVTAAIQKEDGSSDKLTVEVYKNGAVVMSKSTISPKGIVEILADLKPAPTPTPTVVITNIPTTVVPTVTTTAVNVTGTP